ncbi:hypothetical protein [Paenibacillus chitinolyticus]|uniref:hypothetical protein n=1 Tax=Paenibacillus chitinolyticus TaxID=79263 RepID=UPI00295F0794|nr:hypothetical protein [Paenibacillus chitinolyticus]
MKGGVIIKYLTAALITSVLFTFSMSAYFLNKMLLDFPTLLFLFGFYGIPLILLIGTPVSFVLDKISQRFFQKEYKRKLALLIMFLSTGTVISLVYNIYLGFLEEFVLKLGLVASMIFYFALLFTKLLFRNSTKSSPSL